MKFQLLIVATLLASGSAFAAITKSRTEKSCSEKSEIAQTVQLIRFADLAAAWAEKELAARYIQEEGVAPRFETQVLSDFLKPKEYVLSERKIRYTLTLKITAQTPEPKDAYLVEVFIDGEALAFYDKVRKDSLDRKHYSCGLNFTSVRAALGNAETPNSWFIVSDELIPTK